MTRTAGRDCSLSKEGTYDRALRCRPNCPNPEALFLKLSSVPICGNMLATPPTSGRSGRRSAGRGSSMPDGEPAWVSVTCLWWTRDLLWLSHVPLWVSHVPLWMSHVPLLVPRVLLLRPTAGSSDGASRDAAQPTCCGRRTATRTATLSGQEELGVGVGTRRRARDEPELCPTAGSSGEASRDAAQLTCCGR